MIPHFNKRDKETLQKKKRVALRQLIRRESVKNALIFCNRKRDVDIVNKSLQKHGFNSATLHGDMSQPARTATMDRFKSGGITLLVCSDVAARGLDIDDLSHVLNFDVPTHAEDYVHRIGRTGRAGKTGTAYTIAWKEEQKFLEAINRLIGKDVPYISLGDLDAGETDLKNKPYQPKYQDRTNSNTSRPREYKKASKSNEKIYDDDEDELIIGMGGHVPAFLKRPVKG